jgi:outer membrane protein assembly factor BamB
MSTIELGEITSEPHSEAVHEFHGRLPRRLALGAALLLCLFGVTRSALPAPPGVRPLWSVPITGEGNNTLGSDAAYVQGSVDGRTRLTAYDLATGTVRWATAGGYSLLGYAQLAESAGLLLLPADPVVSQQGVQFHRTTIALDARNGHTLWSAPGEAMVVSGGDVLMAEHDGDGGFTRLRLLRLDGRAPVWQRDVADVASIALALAGDNPDKIITVTDDGDADVLRFADGDLVAHARIPWNKSDLEQRQYNELAVSGDHLVVNRSRQEHADLSVYRLDTLAEQWHADGTDGYAFPCGTGICLDNDKGLTAYDTDSGRVRWRLSGIGNGWSASSDRIVAAQPGDGAAQHLVDPETGRQVGADGTGETVWTAEPQRALLTLKATTSPPGHTSITRWDLATGRRDLLGSMERITVNRCQAVAHYLGCFDGDAFTVTAVGE